MYVVLPRGENSKCPAAGLRITCRLWSPRILWKLTGRGGVNRFALHARQGGVGQTVVAACLAILPAVSSSCKRVMSSLLAACQLWRWS